ncbi:MAG TPA: phage shock protein PspA, partial [Pseudoalteromonas sp.]|nr:phage shock protein PspA [Pseudoalteromonas sp.]
ALNRFERYETKIDGLESQIESYDLGKKSLADEIADLQKNEKIDDELAELKKKLADK